MSFQTLRQLLEQISKPVAAPPPSGQLVKMRIAWAVRVTSRYIPKATCLSQALATQLLLSRRGFSAELRIGVAKDETGQLKAHAWIESEGQIIIGGEESLLHYIPLPSPKENIDERYRRYLLQR